MENAQKLASWIRDTFGGLLEEFDFKLTRRLELGQRFGNAAHYSENSDMIPLFAFDRGSYLVSFAPSTRADDLFGMVDLINFLTPSTKANVLRPPVAEFIRLYPEIVRAFRSNKYREFRVRFRKYASEALISRALHKNSK